MKIMVIGANGLCGTSLIPLLEKYEKGSELILIDSSEESMPPIINALVEIKQLWHILRSFGMERGDILIDLTTELSKLEVMQEADGAGVSVINATLCEKDRGTLSLVDLLDKKLLLGRYKWQAPHIPCAGMNPGNVNALLGMMIEKYGNPVDVTEWELDSTTPLNWDGEGFATWSPAEFASEFSDESTWEIDGKRILFLEGPPIDNLLTMPDGNAGALCPHEEILKWGWDYGCKARYIYGYLPDTLAAIEKNIRAGLELPLCRKMKDRIPSGGDTIGLVAEFNGGKVIEGNISASNEDEAIPVRSNATSYLVACGLISALQMMGDKVDAGLNWPEKFGSKWIQFLRQNKLCDFK
jgi:hypothetical protein